MQYASWFVGFAGVEVEEGCNTVVMMAESLNKD